MILVTGGTGVVGSRVVQSLIDSEQQVRIYARGMSDWNENKLPYFRRLGVDVIAGDMRNEERLAAAVSGCQGVIHLAGVFKDTVECDVQSVNVKAVAGLLRLAEAAGVQRFVHLSCLGATEFSSSKYLASKWHGEALVKKSNFYWTVFRPSLIFGPTSILTRTLDFLVNCGPIIPVIGGGLNRIAPISADDVAAAIVQSLYSKETVNQSYDLVGPQSYSLTEMLEIASSGLANRKPMVNVPSRLGLLVCELLERCSPRVPISPDVIRTLSTEISGNSAIIQENFQVPMVPFETAYRHLPDGKRGT